MAVIATRFEASHALIGFALRVSARHSLAVTSARFTAAHALRGPTALRFLAGHALSSNLGARFAGRYDLVAVDEVAARFRGLYSMFTPGVEFAPSVTATIGGVSLGLASFSITASEDSYCLQCEAEVEDATAWGLCSPGAALMVTVGSSSFSFLVDERSRSRQFSGDSFKITARSAASRLDKSYAGVLSRSWSGTTAKTVAQDIADAYGLDLDWQIIDWPLASYASDKQSPLEALNAVKTEAAVLLSDADGGLVVRWLYPISPTQYADAAPALELSDYDDIAQIDDSLEVKPGYNAVRVMDDGSTSSGAEVALQEWTGPNANDPEIFPLGQRCVAAFSHPYQTVALQSNCPVTIYAQGKQTFTITEERVSVVQGKATLSYPCDEILSWTYHCADLGALSAAGKALTAATAGQSLVTVTYKASYQRFLVETGVYKKMQLWAEVSSDISEASNILQVVREPGDNEAPDVIADALCTCEAIARERGRNYLDAEGFSKMLYEATTPPRGFVLPGAIAKVDDSSTGEAFYAKVTGWTLSWEDEDTSVKWDLERAVS